MILMRGDELANIMDRRVNECVPVLKEDNTNGRLLLIYSGGAVTGIQDGVQGIDGVGKGNPITGVGRSPDIRY